MAWKQMEIPMSSISVCVDSNCLPVALLEQSSEELAEFQKKMEMYFWQEVVEKNALYTMAAR